MLALAAAAPGADDGFASAPAAASATGAAPTGASATTALVLASDEPPPISNVPDPAHAPVVAEGEHFHCVLTVVNPHDRAVRVKLVDPSCSCAIVHLDKEFLLPGERTLMSLDVPTANRSGAQRMHVSIFLTDPEFSPIECDAFWSVHATVAVDVLPPGADPDQRPAEPQWQDVYHLISDERPDELTRLRKRILLTCPPADAPAGGLQVTAIDYPGTLWAFTIKAMNPSTVLIIAKARDPDAKVAPGDYEENIVVHTNQPRKPQFTVQFSTFLNPDSGRRDIAPGQ